MAIVQPQRCFERIDDAPRAVLGFVRIADVFQHHGELVATDACDRVLFARDRLQALCGGAQDAVAGGVAHRIVDVLESVKVQEQQRQPRALPACPHDGAGQTLGEQGAVGQVAEGVVVRQVAQFLLDPAALGDVGGDQHVQAIAVAGFGQDVRLHRAEEFAAVLAALPHLGGPVRVGRDRLP